MNQLTLSLLLLLSAQFIAVGQTIAFSPTPAIDVHSNKPPDGGKLPQDASQEVQPVILKKGTAAELLNALITALGNTGGDVPSKPPSGGKPPQDLSQEVQPVILKKETAVELLNALITGLGSGGGDVPEVTASNSRSNRNPHDSVRRSPAVINRPPPAFDKFSAQTFAGDIDCRAWLDTQKNEQKRVVRIIPVRDGTSVFMLERTNREEKFQYTVLPINEAPDERALLIRIRQNAEKTFAGIHRLSATSYLMVFYGR